MIVSEKERSCRDTGASEKYKKNLDEVEGYVIYRRTYQKRLMQIKLRISPSCEEAHQFNIWKEKVQVKLKAFKKGQLTEEELRIWMEENKDL